MNKRDIISKIFVCPVCRAGAYVSEDGKSVFCRGERRHCFDFSADGYLSMSGKSGGDSKAAVNARRSFLRDGGYYEKAAAAIKDAVQGYVPECSVLVDAGCGEGYYTSALSEISKATVGFDLSKFACSAGAKQARREGRESLLYTTASVFELPLEDGCADAVVNVFAPCAAEEYRRVLRDGGYLFVVGAGRDHLMGLKRVLYSDTYGNGERADMPQNMEKVCTLRCDYVANVVGNGHINALFSMTPYYWRTSEEDKAKLSGLCELETEVSFEINVYKK